MPGTLSSGRSADAAPVPDATESDLDPVAVAALLGRLRQRQPRSFGPLDDQAALRRLRVLVPTRQHGTVPTLAGLLAVGSRPQDLVPGVDLTLVVYPGTSANDRSAGEPTSHTLVGPIPVLLAAAVATAAGSMPRQSTVDGCELPVTALREAMANALLHRDYTPGYTAAAQARRVVVAVYARHLTVISPGGLVGPVTEADLASTSSGRVPVAARNPVLAKLLAQVELPGADRTVCTNRGTGIPTIQRELAARELNPAEFHHHPGWFTVILRRPRPPGRGERPSPTELIRAALGSGAELSRWAIEETTGLARGTVMNHLNYLIGNGEVAAVDSPQSRQRTYRLTGRSRPAR